MRHIMQRPWYILAAFVVFTGLVACSGLKIKLDPESQAFYDYARLIMTDDEKDIFTHLPDKEERKRFIQDFWAKRDPDTDTETNEYQEEFFRRIDYANARFKQGTPGWKTDRGRIYIYFGQPDKTEEWQPQQMGGQEGTPIQARVRQVIRWTFYRYGLAIDFYDRRGDNTYVLDDPLNQIYGDYFEALEFAKLGLDFANKERLQEFVYLDFDLEYDTDARKFQIILPIEKFTFYVEEGNLQADFNFTFMLYRKAGGKMDEFRDTRTLSTTEKEVVKMDNLRFAFDYSLEPGSYYVDVTIDVKPDVGKTRKIFQIKR